MFSLTRSSVPPGEHGPTSTKGDFSASISANCHSLVESIAQAEPRARGRAGWHVCMHGTPQVGAEGRASSTASWQRPQFHGGITHDARDKQHHREPLGPQPLPGAVPQGQGGQRVEEQERLLPLSAVPSDFWFLLEPSLLTCDIFRSVPRLLYRWSRRLWVPVVPSHPLLWHSKAASPQ